MNPSLWASPVIGAAIGFGTNYLAIRMLFRPRRRVGFGFLAFQGVLPRRKEAFADNIGSTVEEHLFSRDDVRRLLEDPSVGGMIEEASARKIDAVIAGLGRRMPMIAAFLGGSVAATVREILMAELVAAGREIVEKVAEALDRQLDLRAIVRQRIIDFDLDRLERIALSVARRELRFIEVSGAILGFAIGLAQLGWAALTT